MKWTGYMDGFLKKNLDSIKGIIRKDWDMVFIVDGYEGAGKSVLAQQCAMYLDDTFHIDRIAFTPEEFINAINKANKYEAIVYDEAYGGMSSRAALSEVNRTLVSVLAQIRQKNLFVFIVLPCFFELDKYAAVWRSRGLFHVYTGPNFERGRFTFYNSERKKDLYVLGKKFYSYYKPPPNFRATFTSGYAVDETAYRQKKLDALSITGKKEHNPVNSMQKRWKEERDSLIYLALKVWGKDAYEIGAFIGHNVKDIQDIARKRVLKGEERGNTIKNLQLKGQKVEDKGKETLEL